MIRIPAARAFLLAGLLSAAAACDAQSVSLLNLELDVDNTGYSEESFSIVSDMNVAYQIRVIQGNTVDVRLGSKDDPTSFKPAFSGDQLRERSANAILEKGAYSLRVRESTPKESGVKKATVKITLKGAPSRALRRR